MDGKELMQRLADTWNGRDQEGFLATYTDDCEVTAPGFAGKGRQGLLDFWALYVDSFPDNRVVIRNLVGGGDTAAEEALFEGTHTGPMAGPDGTEIPPTGRQVSVPFSTFVGLRDGRAATQRFYFDQMEMLGQLGLLPG